MNKSFLVAVSLTALLSISFSKNVSAEDLVISDGKTVSMDYSLTVEGKVVDSSEGKKPLEYVQGSKQIIPELEKQLAGLKVGAEKTVVLSAEQGYGKVDPTAVKEVERKVLPQDAPLVIGTILEMKDPSGAVFPCRVTELKDKTVMLDFNHPLAGKELNFQIKIVAIK